MTAARRCDWCREIENGQTLRHALSTARRDGRTPRDFCSDECLRDWVLDRIEHYQAKLAAVESVAQ